ncbi:MAG: hypothetical protein ACRCX2_14105 [Paraclostridium sp.]
MKKNIIIVGAIILGGIFGIYKENKEEIYLKHSLNSHREQLQDVYLRSKDLEKLSRHGIEIPRHKWAQLKQQEIEKKLEIREIEKKIEIFELTRGRI